MNARFAARRRYFVATVRYITISVKEFGMQSEFGPVGDSLYGQNMYAPVETDQKLFGNMHAAQLAINDSIRSSMLEERFSKTFLKYHKACVEVIFITNGGRANRGSGIICQTFNSRVILITAAHIFPELHNSGSIVIESDYHYSSRVHGQVLMKKVEIPIMCCGFKINTGLDTAVFWLNENTSTSLITEIGEFPYLSLASTSSASDMFMSIHYADDHYKKVCVGRIGSMLQDCSSLRLKIHIDGGPGASGAPLFNIEGYIAAILQSNQRDQTRAFLPIKRILLELNYYNVHIGLELQHIVEKNEGEDLKAFLIKQYGFGNANESVSIFNTMLYKNPDKLSLALFHGLGHGGAHKDTRRWSLLGYIDSDHFPAYSAYNHQGMSKDLFPAITIPKVIHDILQTTGRRRSREEFRSTQRNYIREGNCFQAIVLNFNDYEEKGLFKRSNYNCSEPDFKTLADKYFKGFKKALEVHQKLKLISKHERKRLNRHIRGCIYDGRVRGKDLKPDDKIRI